MTQHNEDNDNREAIPVAPQEEEFEGPPRWLKRLVLGMGVLLLVGIFGLFGLVIVKATSHKKADAHGACAGYTIALKGRGQLIKIEEDEKAIKVWLKQNDAINLRYYHPCTGEILRDVTIESDPVLQGQPQGQFQGQPQG